mgnify:FL=1
MKFLIVADAVTVALSIASVGLLVILGLIFASRRVWWATAICFAIAAAPYGLHMLAVRSQDNRVDARVQQVAAFERTPLGPDYPRVLEAELREPGAGRFLALGLFDQVHSYDPMRPDGDQLTLYRWTRSAECDAMAEAVRQLQAEDDAYRISQLHIETCVTGEPATFSAPRPDAVLLLRDSDTTMRRRFGNHAGEQELRLRRDGESVLVDYEERTVVTRPRSAALGQSVLIQSEYSARLDLFDFVIAAIPVEATPKGL